ncbi:MAG: ShlB/FhaC/HecB family hemolysin secretion/activation protein, partial [Methylophilaceae bacterium]
GSLLKQEKELQQQQNLPRSIPKSLIEDNTQQPEKQNAGETIFIKEFKFEGEIKAFTKEALKKVIQDLYNKELTFADIQSAASRIKNFYNQKGYFLANAVIPKQEVQNGIVIIVITEGKLDSKNPYIIKKTDLRLKEDIPKQYLTQSMNGEVTQQGLERGLLNFNDTPGVAGTITLEPGDEPGTTKIILDVVEGPLLSGSVTVDNYGSRYTGEIRTTGTVNINNPTKYGDQVGLTKIIAPKDNFDLNQATYSFPLGRSGLRGTASYSKLEYKIGKELETNPMSMGTADLYSTSVKYPLYRTAKRSFFVDGSYDKKKLYNESTGTVTSNKELDNYGLGFTLQNTDEFITAGFSQLSFTQTYGDLDLSKVASSLTSDQGAGGAKTNGSFEKSALQLLRIQRVTEKLNLQLLANAQFANKNLDSSEKLSLGGATGVRAYPSGEASGDEGRKVSIDAKYNVKSGTKFGDIIASVFYDYGKIRQYKDTLDITMTTPNEYSLEGWGVALDLIAAGKYNVKVGWADAIGGNPGKTSSGNNSDGKGDLSRYWFLASMQF